MLRVTLRDLQWRRRRFVIAIVGTSLVFAMTLVLTGLSNGFRVEANNTVDALGFRHVRRQGRTGGSVHRVAALPRKRSRDGRRIPGVTAAAPLAYTATTVPDGDSTRNVNVFGAPAQGPGMPPIASGRAPSGADEAAVSSTLGARSATTRDRFALNANRRHRRRLNRAGRATQCVPDGGRRAADGIQRSTDRVVDRHARHARARYPTAIARSTAREPSTT